MPDLDKTESRHRESSLERFERPRLNRAQQSEHSYQRRTTSKRPSATISSSTNSSRRRTSDRRGGPNASSSSSLSSSTNTSSRNSTLRRNLSGTASTASSKKTVKTGSSFRSKTRSRPDDSHRRDHSRSKSDSPTRGDAGSTRRSRRSSNHDAAATTHDTPKQKQRDRSLSTSRRDNTRPSEATNNASKITRKWGEKQRPVTAYDILQRQTQALVEQHRSPSQDILQQTLLMHIPDNSHIFGETSSTSLTLAPTTASNHCPTTPSFVPRGVAKKKEKRQSHSASTRNISATAAAAASSSRLWNSESKISNMSSSSLRLEGKMNSPSMLHDKNVAITRPNYKESQKQNETFPNPFFMPQKEEAHSMDHSRISMDHSRMSADETHSSSSLTAPLSSLDSSSASFLSSFKNQSNTRLEPLPPIEIHDLVDVEDPPVRNDGHCGGVQAPPWDMAEAVGDNPPIVNLLDHPEPDEETYHDQFRKKRMVAPAPPQKLLEEFQDEYSTHDEEQQKLRHESLPMEHDAPEKLSRKSSLALLPPLPPPPFYKPKQKNHFMQRICWYFWVLGLLLLLALVLMVIVAFSMAVAQNHLNQSSSTGQPQPTTTTTTQAPSHPTTTTTTAPPTSFLDSLPLRTKQAIEDPSSPQALAYRWVVGDPQKNEYDYTERMHRLGLATLFFATRGEEGWTNDKDWLSYSVSECDWAFNSCENGGSMWQTNNRLQGTLPPEMGLLQGWREIALDRNDQLVGTLPKEMGILQETLYSLNLQSNSLTGTIPPEWGEMNHLKWLYLNGNHLNGTFPQQLFISGLRYLWLHENQLSGALPQEDWQHFSQLRELLLHENQFTGPIPDDMSSLKQVRFIDLHGNNLTGTIPKSLGLLTQLEILDLHGNQLSGSVPREVCDLFENNEKALHTIVVDCDSVQCDCDCKCATNKIPNIASTTTQPSMAPSTAVNVVSLEPTNDQTAPPTIHLTNISSSSVPLTTTKPSSESPTVSPTVEPGPK